MEVEQRWISLDCGLCGGMECPSFSGTSGGERCPLPEDDWFENVVPIGMRARGAGWLEMSGRSVVRRAAVYRLLSEDLRGFGFETLRELEVSWSEAVWTWLAGGTRTTSSAVRLALVRIWLLEEGVWLEKLVLNRRLNLEYGALDR